MSRNIFQNLNSLWEEEIDSSRTVLPCVVASLSLIRLMRKRGLCTAVNPVLPGLVSV
jgi:hypothetical protein